MTRYLLQLFTILLFCLFVTSIRPPRSLLSQTRGYYPPDSVGDLVGNCEVHYFTQDIDHFGWEIPPLGKYTYNQRYFVCREYWDGMGPIFFYVGNEADVTLYLNATGLMWENAAQFHALLIFAEHRYFGKSLPFGDQTIHYMNYLSSEQALADYATLIFDLRQSLPAPHSAVIGFGGSYGGMLAAWLRIKYPSALDGAICGSAPILSFLGEDPPYDPNSFANIETADATPACRLGVQASWDIISKWAQTESGRTSLATVFHLCQPLATPGDAMGLYGWASSAISFMAMGDYPYPTAYMTNGGCNLPAWPMDVGCSAFGPVTLGDDLATLAALRDMVGVFYNCTKKETCFDINQSVNNETLQDGLFWDYLYCTEMTQPFSQNGKTDMFWPSPFDLNATSDGCFSQWGVRPRPYWATINYGGRHLSSASNLVFSNGVLDPWHGGGVLQNVSETVVSVFIEGAAHHLDLMFSNPADPPSVKAARLFELQQIKTWVMQKKVARVRVR